MCVVGTYTSRYNSLKHWNKIEEMSGKEKIAVFISVNFGTKNEVIQEIVTFNKETSR